MTKILAALVIISCLAASSFAEDSIKDFTEDTRVFKIDSSIKVKKAHFHNRYGIELTGDLYLPANFDESKKYAGIAVAGPFGAVKEQVSGLYAQEMAKAGYVAIAFDPSFTGESGGAVRYVSSPEINTEDFSAAVDFLSVQKFIDPSKIGIIGVCGWGGIGLNAAAADTRIKATVSSTMYNLSRVSANGYFDSENSEEARYNAKKAMNEQRIKDYLSGTYARAGGVIDPLPKDAPQFVKDYYAYYKTPRGYHKRSLNSNEGWNVTAGLAMINMPMLTWLEEIRSAVLIVHGEKAHSRYMGEDAFKRLKGDNKKLIIVPDASHCDLYDNLQKIPFSEIIAFMNNYVK